MTNWENKIKWTLWLTLFALTGTYFFLVNSSIFAVAGRQDNEEKISQLEATVSALEADYLSRLGQIDLDYALTLGYVDAANQANYVVASRPFGLLAINDEI